MEIPEIDPTYICPDESVWERWNNHHDILNILLTGDTGTGKTTYAHQYAARYRKPTFTLECGAIAEPEQLIGMWEVRPIEGDSSGAVQTHFELSPFLQAVQHDNAVVVLNEINRFGNIRAENVLLSLLDHQRELFVQELRQTVKVGKGVVFIATINEGSKYTATDQLDWSLRNRMTRFVRINWLEKEQEIQVLTQRLQMSANQNQNMTMLEDSVIEDIVRFAGAVRGDTETNTGQGTIIVPSVAPISLRQLQATGEEMMLGASIRQAVQHTWSAIADVEALEVTGVSVIEGYGDE